MRLVSIILPAALVLGAVACGSEAENTGSAEGAASAGKKIASATFDCKTTGEFFGKTAHTFTFSLQGLDGTTDDLAWAAESKIADEGDEMSPPIVVSPENSSLSTLNENYSVSFEKD